LAVTPSHLKRIERAEYLLEAIAAIRHVGGNHSRFLYEFRPESIVLRVTEDPSPWIMGCFERVGDAIGCSRLVRLVEVGDIPASELIVGGEITNTPHREQLEKLGVKVQGGVKAAIAEAKKHLSIVVP
jgi:CRISPR-associated protein Cst2